mmetsp:Transcript_11834/g.28902  ORF Transcript_11834/g.28902 Transcript_11834/m.28902 type:complete len:210 (-) Transcript_11834:575-1204(-)
MSGERASKLRGEQCSSRHTTSWSTSTYLATSPSVPPANLSSLYSSPTPSTSADQHDGVACGSACRCRAPWLFFRNVPNKHMCAVRTMCNSRCSVNSNVPLGHCRSTWYTQSMNCTNTGDRCLSPLFASFLAAFADAGCAATASSPPSSNPRRCANLCPKHSQLLQMSLAKPVMVRYCGQHMSCTSADTCAVRSQPSLQCSRTEYCCFDR